jgi:hypothetical protein
VTPVRANRRGSASFAVDRGVPLSARRRLARTSPILLLFNASLSLLATLPRAFEVYGTLSSPAIKRITKIGYIEYQFPREIIPSAPYARQPYCDLHRMAAVRKQRSFANVSRMSQLVALPAQFSSFSKKPNDLVERGAILPEKLMSTFEHAQGRSWDFCNHAFL